MTRYEILARHFDDRAVSFAYIAHQASYLSLSDLEYIHKVSKSESTFKALFESAYMLARENGSKPRPLYTMWKNERLHVE